MKSFFFISTLIGLLVAATFPSWTFAQISPEEHAKHHPEQASKTEQGEGGMMGGGMGGMMEGMMEKMGAPKPKEMYPRLMDLPDLPMEERAEIEREAHQRMMDGTKLLSEGLDELSSAAATDDFAAMQSATEKMREGMAQFESGLAAHRALREGKAPRNVALQWFKREMNLLPPADTQPGFRLWGMDAFHATVMLLLVVFSAAMIWMYFFKMRRASALLEKLTADGAGGAALQPAGVVDGQLGQHGGNLTRESPAKLKKWSGKLRVANVFEETPTVKTFRLVVPKGDSIPFSYLPGQFLTLTVKPDDKPIRRSYTIASSPTQRDFIEITVKREDKGVVSGHLHDNVDIGDDLEISAPSGYFTFDGDDANSIVLIAGGVGITPMMSVVRYLTDRCWDGEIFLVFCCRTPDEYIYRDELEHLQLRHSPLHVVTTMSRAEESEWSGPRGRISMDLIRESVPNIRSRRVHICGPPSMMEDVKIIMAELKVLADQVKTENFGPVAKAKPKAATATETPAPTDLPTVTFCHSTKTASLPPDQTILELADELGVEIDNSCRSGTCGMCKVKMLEGSVTMECEDSLEPEEKADGLVLACQAKATTNVVIEA